MSDNTTPAPVPCGKCQDAAARERWAAQNKEADDA